MPCVSALTRARVPQRFELKSFRGKANFATVYEESFAICRDKVRHCMALPAMTVKPEPAIHREDHPISAPMEFPICRRDFGRHASVLVLFCTPAIDRPSGPRMSRVPVPAQSQRK